jgi:hypothetical protein
MSAAFAKSRASTGLDRLVSGGDAADLLTKLCSVLAGRNEGVGISHDERDAPERGAAELVVL